MILLIFLRLIKAVEILDSVSSFELFEISCFRVYTPPYNFLVVIYHCKSANPLFYEFSIKASRNWYSDVIKFCDSHKAFHWKSNLTLQYTKNEVLHLLKKSLMECSAIWVILTYFYPISPFDHPGNMTEPRSKCLS